ncbi:MAG: PLDc N-terminal domain-containing protein [Candidatus Eremiobacteraeota bacterium]|nr:PLDc N-terminal domain-containing protein [Candidatus Eremiobacteraeota bacterium]
MKLLFEIVLAIFLHPIAAVLAWINILTRADLDGNKKIVWALVCILWGIGPILYMLVADGTLW